MELKAKTAICGKMRIRRVEGGRSCLYITLPTAGKETTSAQPGARSRAKQPSDFSASARPLLRASHREQYEGLAAKQAGVCDICRKPPQEPLCVDHSHATGRVRGRPCRKCNTGPGSYDDDANSMAAGIAYLRKAAADDETAHLAASAGAGTPD